MNITFKATLLREKNEWLMHPELMAKLGKFDLDFCVPVNRPCVMAEYYHTINNDGLKQPLPGRVFCNLPYDSRLICQFIERCVEHKNLIALTLARTETKLFQKSIFKKQIRFCLTTRLLF